MAKGSEGKGHKNRGGADEVERGTKWEVWTRRMRVRRGEGVGRGEKERGERDLRNARDRTDMGKGWWGGGTRRGNNLKEIVVVMTFA